MMKSLFKRFGLSRTILQNVRHVAYFTLFTLFRTLNVITHLSEHYQSSSIHTSVGYHFVCRTIKLPTQVKCLM